MPSKQIMQVTCCQVIASGLLGILGLTIRSQLIGDVGLTNVVAIETSHLSAFVSLFIFLPHHPSSTPHLPLSLSCWCVRRISQLRAVF